MEASLIETVKMMGYHHIARHQQKYLNRLIYILLEHLVQHCHRHPCIKDVMGRGSEAEQYVGEAIELFMQERVEGVIGRQGRDGEGGDGEKYADLQREHQLQGEELEEMRCRLGREGKKMAKLVNKYNAMADLTYELRCKQTQQLSLMEEQYEAALIQANQRFHLEREEAIRLSVKLEYLEKENVQLRTRLSHEKTGKNYVVESVDLKPRNPFKRIQSMSILIDATLPMVRELRKQYSLTRCESIDLPPTPQIIVSRESQSTQTSILPSIHEESTQTTMEVESILTQTTTLEVIVNSDTQTDQQQETIPTAEQSSNTDISITHLEQLDEQIQTAQQQISILTGLNSFYFKNYNQMKTNYEQQTQELHKLTRYYNGLYDKHQAYRQQQQLETQQTTTQIAQLQQQIQQLLTEREDLISLVESHHTQPHIPHFETLECLRTTDQSEQTDGSSATPRRKLEQDPLEIHSETTQPSSQSSWKTEEFIKKDTISKYLLQLLEDGCKGQVKAALLHQIGECLGWSSDDMRILQLHSRRVKLKQELRSQPQPPQTFKDRFYHFLTTESDSEE